MKDLIQYSGGTAVAMVHPVKGEVEYRMNNYTWTAYGGTGWGAPGFWYRVTERDAGNGLRKKYRDVLESNSKFNKLFDIHEDNRVKVIRSVQNFPALWLPCSVNLLMTEILKNLARQFTKTLNVTSQMV